MLPYLGIKSGVVSGADRKRSDLSMAELGLAELRKTQFYGESPEKTPMYFVEKKDFLLFEFKLR